jgi:hypothetical protein
MGRPQNEDTSARGLRAKSIVARGADRPLLENREKWRTPSSFKTDTSYTLPEKGPTRPVEFFESVCGCKLRVTSPVQSFDFFL